MVRTIIHGARIGGGRCPNGGSAYRYLISILLLGGGGGAGQSGKWTGAAGFTATHWNFFGENTGLIYMSLTHLAVKNLFVVVL